MRSITLYVLCFSRREKLGVRLSSPSLYLSSVFMYGHSILLIDPRKCFIMSLIVYRFLDNLAKVGSVLPHFHFACVKQNKIHAETEGAGVISIDKLSSQARALR